MKQEQVQPLNLSQQILFSLGQFGWSLSLFCVSSLMTYFYLPPRETSGGAIFEPTLYQGTVLGVFTLIGLITFGGRFFDAITDPWVANLSDRSKSKYGRRNFFLRVSSVPVALLGVLVFTPPIAEVHPFNFGFVIVITLLYYFFITMYCTPFNALICEYGHTAAQRLNLATLVSITWALGFMVGNQVYLLQDLVLKNYPSLTSAQAFQAIMLGFQFLAMIAMLIPAFFINERSHAKATSSDEPLLESVKTTLSNLNFRKFLIFDFTYWLSVSFIQLGISYYVLGLLGHEKSMVSMMMTALFLLSFAFYIPVNLFAKKFSKKATLNIAFIVFLLDFLTICCLGVLPFSTNIQVILVVVLGALPMAVFGIIPTAVVADLADEDCQRSQTSRAGMFFATRTFIMKLGVSLANLVFPSLLVLGGGADQPFAIRLTALAAILFCALGLYFSRSFKEVILDES